MAVYTTTSYEITNPGSLTLSLDPVNYPQKILIYPSAIPNLLNANITVSFSSPPPTGSELNVYVSPGFDLNGHNFDICGFGIPQDYLTNSGYYIKLNYVDDIGGFVPTTGPLVISTYLPKSISGSTLFNRTVQLSSIVSGTAADIIVCDGTGNPSYVALSGDATIDDTGSLTISAGAIDNSKISASAAIALSKLAPLTASKPVVTNGSGVLTTASQITAAQGGTGQDTSSSTGFAKVSSGTWSVDSIAVDRDLNVSFEAGETGDFKIKMGFDGTLTDIYAFATKVIAGTDNGTITPKNNAGTTMTSGTITFTAGDPRGTAYTSTPSANNTFVTGDILTFTTAKTTSGGKVHLSLKFTRTS